MAPASPLCGFLWIIAFIALSRVLLSMFYLDERSFMLPQGLNERPPIDSAAKATYVFKKPEREKIDGDYFDWERNDRDVLSDLREQFKQKRKVSRNEAPYNNTLSDKFEPPKTNRKNEESVKKVELGDGLDFWAEREMACSDSGEGLFLISVINSDPSNDRQRDAIRTTWGARRSIDGQTVSSMFVVGYPTAPSLRSKISREVEMKKDVVTTRATEPQRWKITTPSTTRLMAIFKWIIRHCHRVKYVMIGPDDLFVHPVNMVNYLKSLNNPPNAYVGRVRKGVKPQRDPRFRDYMNESAYGDISYPRYCIGGAGLVVGVDFIRTVYLTTLHMKVNLQEFYLGDVYLGIMAQKLKIWPRYSGSFMKLGGNADYCDLRDTITLGGFGTPDQLQEVWRNHNAVKAYCPGAVPNATDIQEWTSQTDNTRYFQTVLNLIHNPRKACWKDRRTGRAPFLLALVSSMPEHFKLREAIRQSWAAPDYEAKANSKTLFILGKSHISVSMQRVLDDEFEIHNDIIQADFVESFHNLTLKVILGLRWASKYCHHVRFFYKGDDDMLVNFERIVSHLHAYQSQRLFAGHIMVTSHVIRKPSRYQVLRSEYPFKYFLPYFSGGGYIMSSSAVRGMSKATRTTKIIPIDDAYAGILAFRSDPPINLSTAFSNEFITTGSRKDGCYLRRAFNIHGFKSTDIMKNTWAEFMNSSSERCKETN